MISQGFCSHDRYETQPAPHVSKCLVDTMVGDELLNRDGVVWDEYSFVRHVRGGECPACETRRPGTIVSVAEPLHLSLIRGRVPGLAAVRPSKPTAYDHPDGASRL